MTCHIKTGVLCCGAALVVQVCTTLSRELCTAFFLSAGTYYATLVSQANDTFLQRHALHFVSSCAALSNLYLVC